MATVKILYDGEASHLEDYLKRNQEEKMLTTEHGCELVGVAAEFKKVQSVHSSKGNNSIHLIQSWSPAESNRLTKEQVHTMGLELAGRFAPGHQFIVQTHDDQAHLHNHIMINPVSIETGKRIQNKLENIKTVRALNDDIARENGLSVLPPQEKLTRPGPNERAKRIEAYRGRSFILDLSRKAQFARSHATNYDEYLAVLGTFDIQARIEPQNITYFYPGREYGKRGRNLDPDLDKPGLEKRFAENLVRFTQNPELKEAQLSALGSSGKSEFNPDRRTKERPLVSARREEKFTTPRPEVLSQSLIPIEALQLAKTRSILDYCDRERIGLAHDERGRTVLKGRDSLEVTAHSWINHKNKTRGNVIDFVANHREVSLLHAVSHLTDNPRLLLLEKYAGREHSKYRAFYIPDSDSAPRSEAIHALSHLLGKPSSREDFSDLFKGQRIHVSRSKIIRFFAEEKSPEFAEYIPDGQGTYVQSRRSASGIFQKRIKGASEIELYTDPRSLLRHRPDALSRSQKDKTPLLALLEPNIEALHRAIASERDLKRIHLIRSPESARDPESQRFFEQLRDSLNPFSIDTQLAWTPVSIGHSGRGTNTGLEPSRGRDLTFNQGR